MTMRGFPCTAPTPASAGMIQSGIQIRWISNILFTESIVASNMKGTAA